MDREANEERMRNIINELEFIDSINESPESLLESQILPTLAQAVVYKSIPEEVEAFEEVAGLIENRAIGVSTFQKLKGADSADILTTKDRLPGRESYRIIISVNKDFLDDLTPESPEAMNLMKSVMKDTYNLWKELASSRQFVPNYET